MLPSANDSPLRKVATGGGTPTSVAFGNVGDIAVGATAVFWLADDPQTGIGAVMKLAQK